MPQPDDPTTSAPQRPATEERKPKAKATAAAPQTRAADLFSMTIDAANGRIVAIERVDAVGAHQELSEADKTRLAKANVGASLRQLVEKAFEAGIDSVLGESDEDETEESKADGELSRLLLRSLIERSKARELIDPETLDRAIVGTLIGRASMAGSPATH